MIATDRIGALSLLDWPDDQPAPTIRSLRPAALGERALLLIREVAVVSAVDDVDHTTCAEVAACLPRASRPTAGVLPQDADVVLFDDETEAIAVYLRSLATGDAPQQWWWPHVPGCANVDSARVLVEAAHPAAVVARLVTWRAAREVLGGLQAHELAAIVRRIAADHGLEVSTGPIDDRAPDARVDRRSAGPAEGAPAHELLVVTRLGRRGRCAPLATEQLVELVIEVTYDVLGHHDSERRPPSTHSIGPPTTTPARSDAPERFAEATPTIGPVELRDVRNDVNTPTPLRTVRDAATAHDDRIEERTAAPTPTGQLGPTRRREHAPPTPAAGPGPIEFSAAGPTESAPVGERFRTDVAGALYVINPLASLGLLARPEDRDGRLLDSAWDLVEGVVRSLVRHDDDPLWQALATWSGRSDTAATTVDDEHGGLVRRCAPSADAVADRLGLDRDDLAALVDVPGIVSHDLTHIDVEIAIARVDIETRRRGLDTDPGWIPALGRVIRFHFLDALP